MYYEYENGGKKRVCHGRKKDTHAVAWELGDSFGAFATTMDGANEMWSSIKSEAPGERRYSVVELRPLPHLSQAEDVFDEMLDLNEYLIDNDIDKIREMVKKSKVFIKELEAHLKEES